MLLRWTERIQNLCPSPCTCPQQVLQHLIRSSDAFGGAELLTGSLWYEPSGVSSLAEPDTQ